MKQIARNRNEVMQGPAPKCMKILKNYDYENISFYSENYYGSKLIPKIAKLFSVSEDQIIESYGEEDFLRTAFDALASKRDSVLTHEYHYGYYKSYLDFKKIKLQTFKILKNKNAFRFDIEDCIAQYNLHKPKIILITSPNNPTGNSISLKDCERLLKVISPKTILILDEAYWGFDLGYEEEKIINLVNKYPNIAILRSFSKYYALAGLRMGFVLCGKDIKKILRYQQPYLGMSRILEDITIAALDAKKYYQKTANDIINEREKIIIKINQLKNFKAYESKANLILIEVKNNNAELLLKKAIAKLSILSIKKSYVSYWRITVNLPKINNELITLLQAIDKERY